MAPPKATPITKHMPDLSDALTAARSLLGWEFMHASPQGVTAGYIVETEAYMASDAASHTFRGETARNKIMFGPAGYLYVYFTYGMHYCVNIVTGQEGYGEAVLLRALQPTKGVELMKQRRGPKSDVQLMSGPGKLAQAMGIDKTHNGASLVDNFKLLPGIVPAEITQTTRIGISKAVDEPWRFYITGNPCISKH
jgi:DNA-3-methyladenine glycosylase